MAKKQKKEKEVKESAEYMGGVPTVDPDHQCEMDHQKLMDAHEIMSDEKRMKGALKHGKMKITKLKSLKDLKRMRDTMAMKKSDDEADEDY